MTEGVDDQVCDLCENAISPNELFIVGLDGTVVHADCLTKQRDELRIQPEQEDR